MSRGRFVSQVRGSTAVAVLFAALAPAIVLAQQPPAHPRTPWGDPDLQGTYTNNYGLRNSLGAARAEEQRGTAR